MYRNNGIKENGGKFDKNNHKINGKRERKYVTRK